MTARLQMTPSQIPAGSWAVAVCSRCGGHRYLPRVYLIEKAGDVPLARIEARVRCIERVALDRRGAACGGAMVIELQGAAINDTATGRG